MLAARIKTDWVNQPASQPVFFFFFFSFCRRCDAIFSHFAVMLCKAGWRRPSEECCNISSISEIESIQIVPAKWYNGFPSSP